MTLKANEQKMNNLSTLVFIMMVASSYSSPVFASTHDIALSFFSPLPQAMPKSEKDTQAKINLGKRLYFETALSVNNTQSCNSCHNINNGAAGVDHLTVSIGALGELGSRNAPSTWNAGFHVAQFWDGRAKTLEQQAIFPLLNKKEMAMPSIDFVIERLIDNNYLPIFRDAFTDEEAPINIKNISTALAAFQRTLISRDRFDDFLAGDNDAISQREKEGMLVFINKGCVACHNGAVLGGQLFMKMGIVHAYPNVSDRGLAQVTKNSADSYFFKVPSLRNILNTAPYFHDGAAITIEQAIQQTGWHQLGIKLSEEEVIAIKYFFKTLDNQVSISSTSDVSLE